MHQFIPSLVPRDAVGEHTMHMQEALRSFGIESEVFAGEVRSEWRRRAKDYRSFKGGRRGGGSDSPYLVYQASTGSPMAEWLMSRPERKVVDYHNITPERFFARWEPHVAAELALGRRQLAALQSTTTLAFADSAFNERELIDWGYDTTGVVPIMFDTNAFDREVDRIALDRILAAKREGTLWLFVGRISPNKAQHDLVKAFALYRQLYDSRARLAIVGASSSHAYLTAIERFIQAARLGDAIDLTGGISGAALSAYYRAADVFVCLSEHEGFCVPLVESMHHGVPVVAYRAAAVPETVDAAGLVIDDKLPATVAAAVDRVVRDHSLRTQLIASGHRRVAELDLTHARERLRSMVNSLIDR